MFRRSDGASVIVATPTLAQGLNLPAQLAILAGDKRATPDGSGRQNLEAHEILNAAARAGRAGHLANGVVLLIPEPIISYSEGKPLAPDIVGKLSAILPEDDRCVAISDPLEIVLDRISAGKSADHDVQYTVNRMAALTTAEGATDAEALFRLEKSLAAYVAREKMQQKEFEERL
jgi:superfamily II helicase